MTKYSFDLHIDRDLTEPEEDAIEDGIPEVYGLTGGRGSTAVHVAIEGDSFIDAVTTAVWKIEATGQKISGLSLDDTVSVEEIAARAGSDVETARAMTADVTFPTEAIPEAWGWAEVSEWLRKRDPDQRFEIDEQAAIANLILRARSSATPDHRVEWARLLTL